MDNAVRDFGALINGTTSEGAKPLSQQELQAIARQSGMQIIRFDIASCKAEFFCAASDALGAPVFDENFSDSLIEHGFVSRDTAEDYRSFFRRAMEGEPAGSLDVKLRFSEGEYRWYHADYSLIYDEEGRPSHALITLRENTNEREIQFEYEKWRSGLAVLLDESILYAEVNLSKNSVQMQEGPSFYQRPDMFMKSYDAFVHYGASRFPSSEVQAEYAVFFDRSRLLNLFRANVSEDMFEYMIDEEDDITMWVRVNVRMTKHPSTDDVLAVIAWLNIDVQRKQIERLSQIASHDFLTGALNRSAMEEGVSAQLASASEKALSTLYMIDLDNFKQINDTFGHQQGDSVLCQTTEALSRVFSEFGLLGRLGGDEFMVFVTGDMTEEEVLLLADQAIGALELSVRGEGDASLDVSSSIGVALAHGVVSFDQLYMVADEALYRAKQAGKCQYRVAYADERLSGLSQESAGENLKLVQLKSLLEYMEGGVVLAKFGSAITGELDIIYASPSYFRSMGYSDDLVASESSGNRWVLAYISEEDKPSLFAAMRHTAATGEVSECIYRVKLPDRAVSRKYLRISRMPGGSVGWTYLIGVISDISNLECQGDTLVIPSV